MYPLGRMLGTFYAEEMPGGEEDAAVCIQSAFRAKRTQAPFRQHLQAKKAGVEALPRHGVEPACARSPTLATVVRVKSLCWSPRSPVPRPAGSIYRLGSRGSPPQSPTHAHPPGAPHWPLQTKHAHVTPCARTAARPPSHPPSAAGAPAPMPRSGGADARLPHLHSNNRGCPSRVPSYSSSPWGAPTAPDLTPVAGLAIPARPTAAP